jgi:hypothetical protein
MDMGKRTLLLVVVFALVAAACSASGGDSLSAEDQALADAIAQSMMDDSGDDSPFAEEDAVCFGNGIVSEMGSDRLTEVGLSVEAVESGTDPSDVDLSEGDIDSMVAVMTECIDFGAVFTAEFEASGVSSESISCLTDGMDDDLVSAMARSAFTGADLSGDDETSNQIFQLVLDCFSAEDMAKLGGG